METATISDIHILGVDGTGEQVLNGMYKEMTVDRLKRIITMLNRKPATSWESLQLYHLGNEMKSGNFHPQLQFEVMRLINPEQTLEACGIQDVSKFT